MAYNLIKRESILVMSLLFSLFSFGQEPMSHQLKWTDIQEVKISDNLSAYQVYFGDAVYQKQSQDIPVFAGKIEAPSMVLLPVINLINTVYEPVKGNITLVRGYEMIDEEIDIQAHIAADRKQPFLVYSFIPIRKNGLTGQYQKLTNFDVVVTYEEPATRQTLTTRSYADVSVLASGTWFRIAVGRTGIHRITYDDLQQMGVPVDNIDPRNLGIYGNGGGMLPESLM